MSIIDQKQQLKNYLQVYPSQKRRELETFIDNDIQDRHVIDALNYFQEVNTKSSVELRITDMGYGTDDFYIRVGTGMSFLL